MLAFLQSRSLAYEALSYWSHMTLWLVKSGSSKVAWPGRQAADLQFLETQLCFFAVVRLPKADGCRKRPEPSTRWLGNVFDADETLRSPRDCAVKPRDVWLLGPPSLLCRS
jgi:hypothetical protein